MKQLSDDAREWGNRILLFVILAIIVIAANMFLPKSRGAVARLQVGIAETITQLKGVEAATVRLNIARWGNPTNSATITVTLQEGTSLTAEQVSYIYQLVANNIAEITVDDVTVINAKTGATIGQGAPVGGGALFVGTKKGGDAMHPALFLICSI